jgi:hypothetical protein
VCEDQRLREEAEKQEALIALAKALQRHGFSPKDVPNEAIRRELERRDS